MLLDILEYKYRNTKDFQVLEKSFQNDEPKIECPNIKHSILNLLRSSAPCVMRWALSRKVPLDIASYEKELINLLENEDLYIRLKSCQLLTKLYENTVPPDVYFSFLKRRLKLSQTYDELNQLLYFISEVLPNKRKSMKYINGEIFDRNIVKINFVHDETFMAILKSYLRVPEVQYHTLKIIWVLSFNTHCLKVIKEKKILLKIISIMQERSREKLTRLSVAIIRKCIEKKIPFSLCMTYDIIKFCNGRVDDQDIKADAVFIKAELEKILKNTSEIKCYFQELFGGKLEASPFHYQDNFWASNIEILLENKVEIIKALKGYIRSNQTCAVCIAANDLFHFLKATPEIGQLILQYKIKEDLFSLSISRHPDIRFHAIQALSSCIAIDWEGVKSMKKLK